MYRILAIGVFDLFHVGHLRYLQYARTQGDYLRVAVWPDETCLLVKGKCPVVCQQHRLELVRGLACVDSAEYLPCSTEQSQEAASWIQDWAVQRVVVGGGWQGSERWARLAPLLEESGIEVVFAPTTEGISTTNIVQGIKG